MRDRSACRFIFFRLPEVGRLLTFLSFYKTLEQSCVIKQGESFILPTVLGVLTPPWHISKLFIFFFLDLNFHVTFPFSFADFQIAVSFSLLPLHSCGGKDHRTLGDLAEALKALSQALLE